VKLSYIILGTGSKAGIAIIMFLVLRLARGESVDLFSSNLGRIWGMGVSYAQNIFL